LRQPHSGPQVQGQPLTDPPYRTLSTAPETSMTVSMGGQGNGCSERLDITHETKKTKCGLSKPCPSNYFAFKICSGAANVVGPSMCFENQIIMSPVKNNIGRGLNIALVNGESPTHTLLGGDANLLVKFLKEIPRDTLVLVASYDDPGTKMNEDLRSLFSNLGSSYAKQLGFRDSWVFLGARDLKNKSPFEQFLKSNPETNKYDGWPELLELEGCVPRKVF
uniref:FAM3 metabolism regulating signaling molecule D n=1 Tax=Urocitellus parryii TaxID=9999 RepID=A0A8D2KLC0_UROPR